MPRTFAITLTNTLDEQVDLRISNAEGELYSATLEPLAASVYNVDVAQLLSAVRHCLAEIERLGPEGVGEFDWSLAPQIGMRD